MTNNITIPELFIKTCNKFPDRIILQSKKHDGLVTYTYKDVHEKAQQISAFLLSDKSQKHEFAAIALENCPEWAIIYFGIIYAGLTAVPIDPQLSKGEIENLIKDCGAHIGFVSQDLGKLSCLQKTVIVEKNSTTQNEHDCITFRSIIDSQQKQSISAPKTSADDIASLIYTSGTTGQPKGVCLTHKNLYSNFLSIQKLDICKPSDNIISILPLHHTYSFMITLLVPFFTGSSITYPPGLKSEDLINTIRDCSVTILVGVPLLFSLIYNAIFSKIRNLPFFLRPFLLPLVKMKVRKKFGKNLRLFASGGARLDPKIAKGFTKLGFKLTEGYGLTETSPVVTFNPPDKPKFGSVGMPIPDVEIKIFEPDKNGMGQVLVKGPNVMKGYFKRPNLTNEVIQDGWFYTGDQGYIDKHGYLFLTGREKDIIVLSSGKNIYPDELEEYYCQIPFIQEMCVFSVEHEKLGQTTESLYAVIVPDIEYFRAREEIDIEGKIRWELENYSKHISPYKHIMGFTIAKEPLPRTRLRKVKRFEVKQKYCSLVTSAAETQDGLQKKQKPELADDDKQLLKTKTAIKVIEYLSNTFKRRVALNDHLEIDLGIDSLGRVEMAVGLQSLLGIKIPDKTIIGVFTVKELINELNAIAKKHDAGDLKDTSINWNQILKDKPKQQVLDKIELYPGILNRIATVIVKYGLLTLFKIFWSLKITGKHNVPKNGPYILCPNHASYLDAFIVMCSVPYRCAQNLFFFGHRDYFDHPLIAWGVKIARIISIAPSVHLVDAMQSASFVLGHKKALCIFPEGELSIDGSIKKFRKGVGILAKELNVPLVPVLIEGSYLAWSRGMRFPKLSKMSIKFGAPFTPDKLLIKSADIPELDEYQTISYNMEKGIREMI